MHYTKTLRFCLAFADAKEDQNNIGENLIMIIHENLPVYLDTEIKKLRIEDANITTKNRVIADLNLEDSGEEIDTSGARIYTVTGRVFVYERE